MLRYDSMGELEMVMMDIDPAENGYSVRFTTIGYGATSSGSGLSLPQIESMMREGGIVEGRIAKTTEALKLGMRVRVEVP